MKEKELYYSLNIFTNLSIYVFMIRICEGTYIVTNIYIFINES